MRKMFRLCLVVLIHLCSLPPAAMAALPPSAYEELQKNAPEQLEIEVMRVQREPGKNPEEEVIRMTAVALKVVRTGTGIEPGDFLQIEFTVRGKMENLPGPGNPPVLKEGEKTPAFLQSREGRAFYEPAAGAMSFAKF